MPAPTNTLLIEGSFSELAEEFAQYIDALRKPEGATLQSEIAPLLQPLREQEQSEGEPDLKQRDEVLKKLVSSATALNGAPEKEITSSYNLLVHLVHQSSDPDVFLPRICTYLAKPITTSPQFGPTLAISILTTIFNTLSTNDSSRYHVLLAIVAVIRQSGSGYAFEALKPQLASQLETWLTAWELDNEEAQKLHLAIADASTAAGDDELAQSHIVKALETIPAADASQPAARELAVRALASALRRSTVFDFTPLTASDAVQALRSSDSTLFELLEIFTSDTLDAYEAFVSANPLASISNGVLADAGTALQTKMRLLTLTSLAASTPSRSLPYSSIVSALRIPASDVEMWVIDTIRAGLVEGKLSQLKSEFLIHRATYRVFGEKQWAEVQGRLMVWRRSLEGVLDVVRSEKERFVREGIQAAADQEATAGQGKFGDKARAGGDRRRNPQQQQQQQSQSQPQAQPREVEAGAE
ncbi:Eukaryotic translation initiation factor [Penicillium lagena]|uniref:Eukaryotic translation initiation factor n=1 Tax=Penicillium lagena TaxID=94218 RepID=UPI002541F7C3|nr:Eukaryotic translation initiation factor [Penicillium lagena]KAJ5612808.1 Eukaryotic translation initiation factor [Penicillium lagena]